ncbi:ABC transporter substrate-binding protein [Agromyces sp. NPDC058484]|uniref:ABC transporter substrate-binding protein n=1 Tax=Agromyces sp. NPDC058484 TaxID=3346524 RepID=UPI00365673EC
MKRTTSTNALVLAAVAALALSACSSTAVGTPSSTNSADTSGTTGLPQDVTAPIVAAVEVDEDAAARLPEGTTSLTVGSNLQSPPTTFLAGDGTTPIGDEIDIINAIGGKLGVDVQIENMQFDTLINSLETERVDLTIAAMNDNVKRQEVIDFVDYFDSSIGILIQKGNPEGITTTADLCGHDVNGVEGSTSVAWVTEESPNLCENGETINIVTNPSDQQRLNDLKTGRVVAALNDLPYVVYVSQTAGNGNDFEVLDTEPLLAAPYGIGFNKNNSDVRDAVQAALQSLMDDGTYEQILDAWGLARGARTEASINGGN